MHLAEASEEELLALIGPESPLQTRATEELMRRYEPAVEDLVGKLRVHANHRDDALQGARLGLWRAIERFDPNMGASIKTFAFSHMRGGALREIKRMRGRRPPSVTEEGGDSIRGSGSLLTDPGEDCPAAEDVFISELQWGGGHLQDQVSRLPAKAREILSLRYFEDLPVHEVAGRRGVSSAAISKACKNALNKLRDEVNPGVVAA